MSIRVERVAKAYGKTWALRGINVEVGEGELVSVVGPSGCGKTTLLRIIAGFTKPTTGKVIINDRNVTDIPARKRGIGMVFQHYALFPNLTVFENVAFGLRARKEPTTEIDRRVKALLTMVRLEGTADRYPHQLSGGQQQRVAVARALAISPRVLLLDEPLSALDAKVRLELRYELKRIQRESGITAVYVTHDQEEALSISDRVVVMEEGEVRQIGTPEEIYAHPACRFVAQFIGISNLLDVRLESREKGIVKWKNTTMYASVLPKDIEKDSECLMVVRPESIEIISADDWEENRALPFGGREEGAVIEGTVLDRVFLGSSFRYAVSVHGHTVYVDHHEVGQVMFSHGDKVNLRIGRSAAEVIRQ